PPRACALPLHDALPICGPRLDVDARIGEPADGACPGFPFELAGRLLGLGDRRDENRRVRAGALAQRSQEIQKLEQRRLPCRREHDERARARADLVGGPPVRFELWTAARLDERGQLEAEPRSRIVANGARRNSVTPDYPARRA